MNPFTRRSLAMMALPAALALAACDDDPVQVENESESIVSVARDAGSFSTLLTALNAAGLTAALEGDGPFTVFAPSDEAFAAIPDDVLADLISDTELLTAVLTYHVVPGLLRSSSVVNLSSAPTLNGKQMAISVEGGTVRVDNARVTAVDIEATNGIIHVIDQVILPEPIQDIVQLARSTGIFNTLLAAVEAAGLTSVLKGAGPFTVFAPSDEAFAAVPADALAALLADTEALTAVLTYHVVPGQLRAFDVLSRPSLTTVNGAQAPISADAEGRPRIADALITATDIRARNGVVHVIDRVIFPEPARKSIVGVAREAGSFSTLLAALDAAGLTTALEGEGPFTVFAPTDEAFAAIDPEVLDDLLADKELLTAVLTYHVAPGRLTSGDVAGFRFAPTLNGKFASVSFDGATVRLDDARVIATDIEAANGIIHVIDKVILPEPIQDIVQLARSTGIFNTLLAAVDAAGLTSVLKGPGPFTVFAPTDEAFAAVPADALAALLADTEALTAVLTYHVVAGQLRASDVLGSTSLTTVNGAQASVSLDGQGRPRIADAVLLATDIAAKNGLVHVIDRVIFPE
jgi:transforming growth factor-beta-induced protein